MRGCEIEQADKSAVCYNQTNGNQRLKYNNHETPRVTKTMIKNGLISSAHCTAAFAWQSNLTLLFRTVRVSVQYKGTRVDNIHVTVTTESSGQKKSRSEMDQLERSRKYKNRKNS